MTSFTTYRRATDEDEQRLCAAVRSFAAKWLPALHLDDDADSTGLIGEVLYEIDNTPCEAAYLRHNLNKRIATALRIKSARAGLGIGWGYVGRSY